MPTTTSVTFWLKGPKELDPDRITQALELQPTRIWRCRPKVAEQHPELDNVGWVFELENVEEIEYSKALDRLLKLFWPKREQVNQLVASLQLTTSFHLVPCGEMRDFDSSIEAEVVQKLADLGASLTLHMDNLF